MSFCTVAVSLPHLDRGATDRLSMFALSRSGLKDLQLHDCPCLITQAACPDDACSMWVRVSGAVTHTGVDGKLQEG